MARYGFEARTPDGDVVIDGERRHPLLWHETTEGVVQSGSTQAFHDISFPPTSNPVVVTWATEDNGAIALNGLITSGGQYVGARFTIGLNSITSPPMMVTFRVYEI